jgi:hypothetical protein
MENKITCPHCHAVLKSSKPIRPGKAITCLKCQGRFTVRQADQDTLVSSPFQPPRSFSLGTWLVLGGLLLILVVGGGLTVYLLNLPDDAGKRARINTDGGIPDLDQGIEVSGDSGGKEKKSPVTEDPSKGQPKSVSKNPAKQVAKLKPSPAPLPKPKLPKWSQQSIDSGVKFVKAHWKNVGGWTGDELRMLETDPMGFPALTGLTLLECGVSPSDPAIADTHNRVLALTHPPTGPAQRTYDIGLAILFLDRLGKKEDEKVIQNLALRLLVGQNPDGGWPYTCPVVADTDEKLLLRFLQQNRLELRDLVRPEEFLRAVAGQPKPGKGAKPKAKAKSPPPLRADQLPPALRNLPAVQQPRVTPALPNGAGNRSDNSNTQFALLGLWIAQKHGVPMERTFNLVDQRFRQSQAPDGSWAYAPDYNPVPPAMTCAGLLGLAVGHGSAQQVALGGRQAGAPAGAEPSLSDPLIQKALKYLGQHIGAPLPDPNTYYLWSVERVAVLYHLDTIGGKDWYSWGAKSLIASQREDGSWFFNNVYTAQSPIIDTCFALLFLEKANFVPNLSDDLKGYIRVRDPDLK